MNSPKRILYVENGMHGGGSAESLRQLLCVLDRTIYEPIVVFTSPIPYVKIIEDLGVEVHCIDHWFYSNTDRGIRNIISLWASRLCVYGEKITPEAGFLFEKLFTRGLVLRLKKIITVLNIDIIHTNNNVHRDYWAIKAATKTGIPIVSHLRSFHSLGFTRHKAKEINEMVHVFIGYSRSIVEYWQTCGLDASKEKIIPNAVGKVEGVKLNLQSEFGVPEEQLCIGIIGRVISDRGHVHLYKALPFILKKYPDLYLLVVGEGEEDIMARLKTLAGDLNVSERIIYAGYRTDAKDIIKSLDAIVLPYEIEPFGRTVLEAWRLGTPVLLSRVGHINEIIHDDVNGLLFNLNDPQDLANQVDKLFSDREFRKNLIDDGMRTCQERFSINAQADAIQAIYHELLS